MPDLACLFIVTMTGSFIGAAAAVRSFAGMRRGPLPAVLSVVAVNAAAAGLLGFSGPPLRPPFDPAWIVAGGALLHLLTEASHDPCLSPHRAAAAVRPAVTLLFLWAFWLFSPAFRGGSAAMAVVQGAGAAAAAACFFLVHSSRGFSVRAGNALAVLSGGFAAYFLLEARWSELTASRPDIPAAAGTSAGSLQLTSILPGAGLAALFAAGFLLEIKRKVKNSDASH